MAGWAVGALARAVATCYVGRVRSSRQTGEQNSGLLPMLLLPGTLCDARIFAPLRDRLCGIATRVMPVPCAASLEEAAGQVLARSPERFTVLGFSLGGIVAMRMALLAPNRVQGMVLLNTTPLPVPVERHGARRDSVAAARTMPMERFVQDHLWPEYGGAPDDTQTLALLQTMAADLQSETFATQTEMALRRTDLRPRLGEIACPVLVIGGTDDPVCPAGAQQSLVELLPNGRCVMLPGAGHFALVQQPNELAAAVAAWWDAEFHGNGQAATNSEAGPSVGGE